MTQTELSTEYYLCNPSVILRDEDEDGGLLFNPDTNQVKLINSTGLFIWKQCGIRSDLPSLVAALSQAFTDALDKDVIKDVRSFIDVMMKSGFIGIVER